MLFKYKSVLKSESIFENFDEINKIIVKKLKKQYF